MHRVKQSMVDGLETILSSLTTAVSSLGTAAYAAIGAAAGNVVARDAGGLVGSIKSSASTATTSGTSVDVTGIPATAVRVTISLNGVSTNGTSTMIVQLGDAGGVETADYASSSTYILNATPTTNNLTNGIAAFSPNVAVVSTAGTITLVKHAGNTWVASTVLCDALSARTCFGGGVKTLSEALDRIRLTTAGGTDAFDAGSITVLWES